MGTLSQSLFIPLIGRLTELHGNSIAVIIHSFDRSLEGTLWNLYRTGFTIALTIRSLDRFSSRQWLLPVSGFSQRVYPAIFQSAFHRGNGCYTIIGWVYHKCKLWLSVRFSSRQWLLRKLVGAVILSRRATFSPLFIAAMVATCIMFVMMPTSYLPFSPLFIAAMVATMLIFPKL